MSRRIIEETFRAVAPRGRRGIPEPPVVSAGFTSGSLSSTQQGSSQDFTSALSQAGQQISSLQSAYQQQAQLIAANTQALQGNTSAQSSKGSGVAQTASNFLGGTFGFLSPLISGIASLFGGGSSTPATLPVYVAPSPVQLSGTLTAAQTAPTNTSSATTVASAPAAATQASAASAAPAASSSTAHVTVNVSAMDSQSFMDRSTDIANAVRAAMLNLHPINDVIANL